MIRNKFSLKELLLIQEMCLDGELRCWQRAAEATSRHDYYSAGYELQLKEQYADLKEKLVDELNALGNRTLIAEPLPAYPTLAVAAGHPAAF